MINDIANTKLVDLPYTKRLENVISEFENVKSSPSKFCVPLFLTVLTSIFIKHLPITCESGLSLLWVSIKFL